MKQFTVITSNQPGSAENSHSLSVQYETVTRHQQYESIVDTGYEQLTAQYEAVHNSMLEHIIGVVATQGNQLEGRPTADRWMMKNVEDNGTYKFLMTKTANRLTPRHTCKF
jgi:hypothetical protein